MKHIEEAMTFDRDAYIKKMMPDVAPNAIKMRDRIIAMGFDCNMGMSVDFDTDEPEEIVIDVWKNGEILGCISMDEEAVSFWIGGIGSDENPTENDLYNALQKFMK